MNMWRNVNLRVKNLSMLDVKLVQGCAIFLTLIIVKLIPQIMTVHISWFVALLVLCAIKPFHAFFIKE